MPSYQHYDFLIADGKVWTRNTISMSGRTMREAAERVVAETKNSVTFMPVFQKRGEDPLVHFAGAVIDKDHPIFSSAT